MTPPSAALAPPLRTADDVHRRVDALIGRACVPRRIWILLIDGEGRQAPVLPQVDDAPLVPDPELLHGFGRLLAELQEEIDPGGDASVVLVLERLGRDAVLPVDQRWATSLRAMCVDAGVRLRGLYLSTNGGVRTLG